MENVTKFLRRKHAEDFNSRQLIDGLNAFEEAFLIDLVTEFNSLKEAEKEKEIKERCDMKVEELRIAEKEYSKLDQIGMLSGEGNNLQEQINKAKGQIRAFNWVRTGM